MDTAYQLPLPLFPDDPLTLESMYLVAKDICNDWDYDEPGQDIMTFRYLGKGVARAAYDLGNGYVAKIEYDWRGKQSKAEWVAWKSFSDEAKEYLCPIIAHDEIQHKWTIMPVVDMVGELDYHSDEFQKLVVAARKYGIGDLHEGNAGLLNGKPVILDYAICIEK